LGRRRIRLLRVYRKCTRCSKHQQHDREHFCSPAYRFAILLPHFARSPIEQYQLTRLTERYSRVPSRRQPLMSKPFASVSSASLVSSACSINVSIPQKVNYG